MRTGDTIAACATALGTGATRAIIRLSGPEARTLVTSALASGALEPRRVRRAALQLPGRPSPRPLRVPVIVAAFEAPQSYTGEDVIEVFLPANASLVQRVLDLFVSRGARLAGPGEFTARAFWNGRLSLTEADGVRAMIEAESETELIAARALLSGETGARWRSWADEVAHVLALVEAGIDFTDQEDVVAITAPDLRARASAVLEALHTALASAGGAERVGHDPLVVLAGPPNAGKSTLFNAMLRASGGGSRTVEHASAGSTRDAVSEPLDLSVFAPGAGIIAWTDLPGLDASARGAADEGGQRAALDALARADVVVHCDPAGRFEGVDTRARVLRVRTKADLPGVAVDAHDVCALDGYGLGALGRAIADAAGARAGSVLPARAAGAMQRASSALADAVAAAPGDAGLREPELVAAGLRSALDTLGELVGDVTPDDVLGRVFASFCVGK